MRRLLLSVCALSLLAACGKVEEGPVQSEAANATAMAPAADGSAPAAKAAEAPAISAPMLAYAYAYRLALPARDVRPLMERHQAVCEAAGPAVCQVVGAAAQAQGRDEVSASLELRAAAPWLAQFRAGLEAEVKAAGGRIETSGTESEDLTRQVVDTEAYIRARTVMRDRLERLLAERPGKLQDVLSVEQELARVQGEIDSTRSELAVMKTRVATARLTIRYESLGVAAPDGVASPLAKAGQAFLGNTMAVLAGLVTLMSFLLPIGLVAAPLAWWLGRRRRKGPPANVQA